MTEIWLKFRDEHGEDRRVPVEGANFTIGRHADNNVTIASPKLSRQHVKIDRFGDVCVISDLGSSNGTFLNGNRLTEPTALQNGDRINLGGGVEVEVEISSTAVKTRRTGYAADASSASGSLWSSDNSSIPTVVFIIAPVFGMLVLLCVGGIFLVIGSGNGKQISQQKNGIVFSPTPDEALEDEPRETTPTPAPTAGRVNGEPPDSPGPEPNNTQPPVQTEVKKIEQNSALFLRRIALSDTNAFLTTAQVEIVSRKINQLKGSTALAENLKAVKKEASQFESLAQSKGLKGQFLAAAALTKLGGSRGDPLAVATTMLPVLGELRIMLDNNLADDNLLIIAAFERGAAGRPRALRDTLEALSKNNPSISPREIRSIWFLQKQGKITDSEFEFTLRFLAIGTIMQNPKDFNVSAEAVVLN